MEVVRGLRASGLTPCAFDWTGHAACAATAPTEFPSRDREDFNPGVSEPCVCSYVAVVAHHDAWREGQQVVPVSPLLARGAAGVATGGDQAQLRQIQRLGKRGEQ